MKKKYEHLKDKLDEISKNVEILHGKDGMIELDPNNPQHVEWFEEK
jgi:anthranilate phosphoribosyltransferase